MGINSFKSLMPEMESRLQTKASFQIFDITKFEKGLQSPLVKPSTPSWEQLTEQIKDVVNMPGYMETRIKKLYNDGFGAELVTAAEIARATAYKSAIALFTRSTSASGEKWEEVTLRMVKNAWAARKTTLEIIEQLNITDEKQTKILLALAHKLKGRIYQFLSMATKGKGVINAQAVFFSMAYKAAYK